MSTANIIRIARKIKSVIPSTKEMEGMGANVYRALGTPALPMLDPFLMLNDFTIRAPGGFPDHPHRGFETVTYILEGETFHEDFRGHNGHLRPGDVQWISAARGIVHTEIPANKNLTHGIQLWINLSKKDKLSEPNYQEYPKEVITEVIPEDGVQIKIIAGESYGVKSPLVTLTPTMFIDVKMKKGKKMEQVIPKSFNGFIYTVSGSALFGDNKQKAEARHALVLSENGGTYIPVESLSDDCRFFVIAGEPIREPVVQHGPFVMNTEQEIYQAFADFQYGRNGFEGAPGWSSTIRDKWN